MNARKSVTAYVKRAAELEEPNPHVAAEAVFAEIPRALRDELARAGFDALVHQHFQARRKLTSRDPAPPLERAYCVDQIESRWAYLKNLTRLQVRVLAASYRDRAAANMAEAEKFERLDKAMGRANAERAGDLGEDKLAAIFDGAHQTAESAAA